MQSSALKELAASPICDPPVGAVYDRARCFGSESDWLQSDNLCAVIDRAYRGIAASARGFSYTASLAKGEII